MDFLAAGFSTLITIFFLALFGAGVMKLFQIHSTLLEIKESLRTRGAVPTSAHAADLRAMSSGEEMLRVLDEQIQIDEMSRR